MENDNTVYPLGGLLRRYGVMAAIWSVLLGGSLLWAMHQETRNALGAATAAAHANISKDLIFRRWATSHGGVYVPPTAHTPPNPYLNLPDRDVLTTTGKALTLMNPAYMLRELQNDFADDYGARSHITSLKLLNPKNAPDDWETGALRAFEQGEKERLEVQQIDGQPYLRLMLPLIVESGCLKCHSFQGYKVGDIRGGLSTAVLLAPFLARERQLNTGLVLTHGAIWLIGLAGLGATYRRDRKQSVERQKAENDLRESEQKYHMVADYTSDWEYWIGVLGEIIYMSPSCKELTGHDVAEFSADPELLRSLVHPDDRAAYEAHWQVHSEHAAAGMAEFRIVGKDGETRWISHRCRPVFDRQGNWRGIRAGNRDVTARREAEAEIRRLNESLEARVKERTAQLESANVDIESFSYSVSHDLRAPLRAIDGFIAILQEDYASKLDPEGLRLFGVVSDNARKMGQLIENILAFSRASRHELIVAPLDMNALAQQVWTELEPQRAGRGIEFRLADLPAASADRTALHQVMQNLLGNAVKFSRGRAAAIIEVEGRREGNENIYSIRDNGAGFDMAYAGKLFGLFQRLHGMDEFEGSGVGLAIVKRFVAKHGGRVWAEGKPGAGATFSFSLPLTETDDDKK
jgi:PAS domain S-box-containing protein